MSDLYKMLREGEGENLKLYKDTEGFWTIGIGHLVTKDPSKEKAISILDKDLKRITSGVINKSESEQLFTQDTSKALRGIEQSSLSSIYISMNGPRRTALVNMVYQLGLTGVLGFRKMVRYLELKQYNEAADEALNSRWARQTPNRAHRVTETIRNGGFSAYAFS
ncbi:lysozyme [Raoultella sp. BIGb0149]|uniref:glycoside hydrolase family protein n=1 Tax=Raoultella sp. BIGb0149 TaxID=2485116 RepID=UPI0010ED0998|nr:glycoside hydrolase family protein [Raoultella sp. BIGb0149]TDQ27275.1 lysozyme [Raoultella sp. BIGb0149]